MVRWHVVLPASAITFASFVGYSAFYPFIFLWLERQGFNEFTRSMVGGGYFVSKCLSPLLWGRIADRWQRHTTVLIGITLVGSAAVVWLSLQRRDLALQAALFAIAGFFDNLPMLEAIVVRCLHHMDESALVRHTRALASAAVGLCCPFFGFVSNGSEEGIAVLFVCYAGMMTCIVLPVVLLFMPVREAYAVAAPDEAAPEPKETALASEEAAAPKKTAPKQAPLADESTPLVVQRPARLLCTWRMSFFWLTFALVGVQMGVASACHMVYLARQLHAPGVLLGLAEAIPVPLQIGIFLVADRIVTWLTLPVAMHTCALAGAVRFAGFALVRNPWLVAFFELAWGWTFPIFFTVSIQLAEEFAPSGLQASVISLNHTARQLGATLVLFGSFAPLAAFGYPTTYALVASALALFAAACGALTLLCPGSFGSSDGRVSR